MASQLSICFVAFLTVLGLANVVMGQDLRALARKQARENPGVPVPFPPPTVEYPAATIEDLVKTSDVVVLGKLSEIKSYLAPREDSIFTDYRLVVTQVVSGSLGMNSAPAPGPGAPLSVSVWGGQVTIEGVRIDATDHRRIAFRDGGDYLLFLRRSPTRVPGQYEIHYPGAFEINGVALKPVLKNSSEVFQGPVEQELPDMLSRIRRAMGA
jgi:hypothetical protein